jgi:DNA-binding CsgD family transcriptional regulator
MLQRYYITSLFLTLITLITYVTPTYARLDSLKRASSRDRIIYLHYMFGNDVKLVEDTNRFKRFIDTICNKIQWNDPEFERHLKFFQHIYPNSIEKSVKKRIELTQSYLDLYPSNSNFHATLLHQIGTNYFVQGDYATALDHFVKANLLFTKIGWDKIPEGGAYLHDISLAYYTVGDYSKAINCMHIALSLPSFSPNLDLQRLNTLGASYEKLQEIDSAVKYYKLLKKEAHLKNDSFWIVKSIVSIGELSNANPDTTLAQIKGAITYMPAFTKDSFLLITDEIYLYWMLKIQELNAYIAKKQPNLAAPIVKQLERIKIFDDSTSFRGQQRNENFQAELYESLLTYYRDLSDYESAFYYSQLFSAIDQRLKAYECANLIQLSEDKLLLSEKNATLERLDANKKLNYVIIALLGISTVSIALLFLLLKNKKAKELAIINAKNKDLEHQVEINNSQLENYVQNMVQKNEMLETISDELERLKAALNNQHKEEEIQHKVSELRQLKILTPEDWTKFQSLFEKVNKDLTQKLYNAVPKLTEAEIRYLMLYSLNLNNKDIASSLGISADSLRVTWSRIKKKYADAQFENPKQLLDKLSQNFDV